MNILFLMGGNSDKNKEDYPLYLTEVKGKTILEKQIESAEALHRIYYFLYERNRN